MSARRPRAQGTGSIERRGESSWRVTVFRGRTDAGELERRRFAIHGTRKDAERALREALSERDRGIDIAPAGITAGAWLVRWLGEHSATREIEETTRLRYERIIRRQLVPALGEVKLQALRPLHVRTLYADAALTVSARRRAHVVLCRALDDAVRAQLLALNPARSVHPPSEHGQRRHPDEQRVLDEAELRALLAQARHTPHETPVRLTLATGLRQGELLALRWADIDLEGRTLTVSRNVQVLPRIGVQFRPPKTRNSRRTLELSAATVTMLRQHRASQREHRLKIGPAWQDGDLIFPSLVGSPWIPRNFYRGYRRVIEQSALTRPEEIVWHTLRHTAATHWIKAGVEIHIVSRRLGHASATFTMDTYGHLLSGMQQHAAEAMDHLLAT